MHSLIHFNLFLDPGSPDQDAMHLAAAGRRNRCYVDGVGFPKRVRLKEVT